jgi:hypothetical protein
MMSPGKGDGFDLHVIKVIDLAGELRSPIVQMEQYSETVFCLTGNYVALLDRITMSPLK